MYIHSYTQIPIMILLHYKDLAEASLIAISSLCFLQSQQTENVVAGSLDRLKDGPDGSIAGESQEQSQRAASRGYYCVRSHESVLFFDLHFGAGVPGIEHGFVFINHRVLTELGHCGVIFNFFAQNRASFVASRHFVIYINA